MEKLKFSYPPSQTDLLRKNRNSSEQSHRHPSGCTDSSTFACDKLLVVRPPCPLTVFYAEEEVSVFAEEEVKETLDDEKKKDKRKKKKGRESRRSSSERQYVRSASKDRFHGKTGYTSESKGERREPYQRWNREEVKNPERRRQLRKRYTAKSMVSDSPSPPADMVWRDRKLSQRSHSHAITKTDSSTFVRAELAVVPPAPVTDAIYPVEFAAYGKEEALYDKERKDKKEKKKNKETQRSSSERQSSRWERKERHYGKDGNTLDTMGECAERLERRKQEEKNPELRKEHKERRESTKSRTSHRRSVRNNQAGDEKHLDGHALRTPPIKQPERVTKPTEVDCDRLLMQLLHAQHEMLKAVTVENDDGPPASHPLILTWDQDFQEAFDAFTHDTTENFEKSFGEISHQYFLSKDPRHKSFHETPRTPTIQKGVLNADALKKNAEKKEVSRGDEFFEISRTPFHRKKK